MQVNLPRLTFSSSKISISITNSRPSNQIGILGLEGDFRIICMSHIKPFFPPPGMVFHMFYIKSKTLLDQ